MFVPELHVTEAVVPAEAETIPYQISILPWLLSLPTNVHATLVWVTVEIVTEDVLL
jgi:hypothetical protein